MSIQEQAISVATSAKVATAVAAATTGTGVSAWLAWIPDDVGKLATVVGIVLSLVLIRVHLVALEKLRTEIAIMRVKEAERTDESGRRRSDHG